MTAIHWSTLDRTWHGEFVRVRWDEPGDIGQDRRTGRPETRVGIVRIHRDRPRQLVVAVNGRIEHIEPPGHAWVEKEMT